MYRSVTNNSRSWAASKLHGREGEGKGKRGGKHGGREGGREGVDKTPVTRQQKLRLYRAGICPRMSWDLTINSLPLSWVTGTLEATATRFLKRWSGLAKSADTARLYLPQSQGGLNLPPISLLYKKHQVSQACQLLASTDPAVRFTTTVEIRREEALQRATHRPMLAA